MLHMVVVWYFMICAVDTHKCSPSPFYDTSYYAEMDRGAISYPYYTLPPVSTEIPESEYKAIRK